MKHDNIHFFCLSVFYRRIARSGLIVCAGLIAGMLPPTFAIGAEKPQAADQSTSQTSKRAEPASIPATAPLQFASKVPLQLATSAPLPPDSEIAAYLVSEKLDGVRGRWNGRTLESRTGNLIAAPAWFTAKFPKNVTLDGELWAGRGRFEWTSALLRSSGRDSDWQALRFMVFDSPMNNLPFRERLVRLEDVIAASHCDYLLLIPQLTFTDVDSLKAHFSLMVSHGAEGLMLHHGDARYIDGRNPLLIKLKPLNDAEGEVIGYKPGRGELTGLMGALKLRLADGSEFFLGTGFDLATRRTPPPIGTMVTFEYNGLTKSGKPKGARFLRVRPRE
ncbi:DNA ligase [Shewanella sp. JM162201]|uniref:DNA ligase n=1 Tax=Shewanella jiangmenensis TaxID=2837387 RepID=A0ABS5V7F0_9GAMM|nr:DNA ligase [Shewanella jiangmenensis]MBT1445880.1 DNA ligase [Shewanella jiangmenensis]